MTSSAARRPFPAHAHRGLIPGRLQGGSGAASPRAWASPAAGRARAGAGAAAPSGAALRGGAGSAGGGAEGNAGRGARSVVRSEAEAARVGFEGVPAPSASLGSVFPPPARRRELRFGVCE